MLSRIWLWLFFVTLTPAGPELAEWATHYVQDGDFADASDARHRRGPAEQSEHGCAVLCHSCTCHGPTAPVRDAEHARPLSRQPLKRAWTAFALLVAQSEPEPSTPPPIA